MKNERLTPPSLLIKVCIAACMTSVSFAQSLTIDDFLATPIASNVVLSQGSSASYTVASPGALGGGRAVTFTNNYVDNSQFSQSNLNFETSTGTSLQSGRPIGGSISLPSGGETASDVDLEFVYFANGTDFTPYPEIALLWEGDHHGNSNGSFVELELEDSAGNMHPERFSWAAGITPDPFFIETLRWDLNDYAIAGVDISDIDKITLRINTDRAGDYSFTSLSGIPEPSTSIMIALSSTVFLFRRKRRS